jgi:hypothetical protein
MLQGNRLASDGGAAYNAHMDRRRRHWSAYAWIACLAILFNACAPFMHHALAASTSNTNEMEVCTALGLEMMPMSKGADQPGKSAPDKLQKGMTHCACCTLHASTFALPPAMTLAFALSEGRDVYPPLYYHAARPLFPWSLAQSRAPPALA